MRAFHPWLFFGAVLAAHAAEPRTYRDATPQWPARGRPAAGAPNVIVILWDDVGFGQFGCYGSSLATPNIDRLARGGIRYNNFHVRSVCSPTRAALLSGRNPHAVGVATIAEYSNGFPNSRGGIRPDAVTLAQHLSAAGYSTYAVGKWHLAPMADANPAGESAHWPTGRGFDHFYGYIGGDMNQFAPEIFADRTRVTPAATRPHGGDYFMDADFTDRAIDFLSEQRATAAERPFFLYLAYCAGHAPHHAPPELLAKWRGKFDAGWDAVRAATLERQKQLGLIPRDTPLPPPNPGVKPWAELSADERRLFARYYECFAACLEATDREMGRLLDWLERTGEMKNTLILLASDNGASPEGGAEGIWNEMRLFSTNQHGTLAGGLAHYDQLGGPMTYPTYPIGWTQAGNTPFRRQKGTVHEGGIRTPLIAHWPARITDAGAIRPQFTDVTDVLPTVLDVAGITPTTPVAEAVRLSLNSETLTRSATNGPISDGTSLAYTWPKEDAAAPARHRTQHFEIYGHRAIVHEGWKLVAWHKSGTPWEQDTWELYDLANDPTELRDLAKAQPAKVAELLAVWEREAQRNDVYPLDDRFLDRDMLRPPENLQRTHVVYHPPLSGLHKYTAPERRNLSMTLTVSLDRAATDASGDGVLVAHGGRFAGYALYILNNRLVFHYNYAGEERTTVTGAEPLPAGAHTVRAEFALAKAGDANVTLSLDGRAIGRGRVPHAMPGNVSHETLDFGCDLYTPVSEDYAPPFAFRGTIREVVFDTAPPR
ncbi:MAG: sulfatase-like hydrolase/transferase [Verrucomicrobia bacterium]|nr:sulfatase-like hydrolase/transferase [Verrucomicrobiota bacterium]